MEYLYLQVMLRFIFNKWFTYLLDKLFTKEINIKYCKSKNNSEKELQDACYYDIHIRLLYSYYIVIISSRFRKKNV